MDREEEGNLETETTTAQKPAEVGIYPDSFEHLQFQVEIIGLQWKHNNPMQNMIYAWSNLLLINSTITWHFISPNYKVYALNNDFYNSQINLRTW